MKNEWLPNKLLMVNPLRNLDFCCYFDWLLKLFGCGTLKFRNQSFQ